MAAKRSKEETFAKRHCVSFVAISGMLCGVKNYFLDGSGLGVTGGGVEGVGFGLGGV